MKRKMLSNHTTGAKRVFPSEEKRKKEVHALLSSWNQAIVTESLGAIGCMELRMFQDVGYGSGSNCTILHAFWDQLEVPQDFVEEEWRSRSVHFYTLFLVLRHRCINVMKTLWDTQFPTILGSFELWTIFKGLFSTETDTTLDAKGREVLKVFLTGYRKQILFSFISEEAIRFLEDDSRHHCQIEAKRLISVFNCLVEDCGITPDVFHHYACKGRFRNPFTFGNIECVNPFTFFVRICGTRTYPEMGLTFRSELLLVEWFLHYLTRFEKIAKQVENTFHNSYYGDISKKLGEMEKYVQENHRPIPAHHELSRGFLLFNCEHPEKSKLLPIIDGHVPSLFWQALLKVNSLWSDLSIQEKAAFAYRFQDPHLRKLLLDLRLFVGYQRDLEEELKDLDFMNAIGEHINSESDEEVEEEEQLQLQLDSEPALDIPPL